MPRSLIATLAVALIAIILIVPTVAAHRRAAPTSTPPSITTVSPLQGNGWTVQLNDGTKLFVEVRALDTAGRGPRPGQITDFTDQWQLVGMYGGHATFKQGGLTYYAFRP
jgi:ABC-type sugar transport system substrate-binding protein